MNTLVIVLIAAVCLFGAYVLYGRWLANKWGIDPSAKTPAVVHEDGRDYVPTDGWTVFAHQFSSIAGAGPVTGAIQAAAFGWLPVLLWVLIGGNILNIFGNWVLIYGQLGAPELGLTGAGLSTLASRVVMAVAMMVVFFSRRKYRAYAQGFLRGRINRADFRQLNLLGWPIALQMGMETSAFSLTSIIVGWIGTTALAAHQVMLTISQVGFMVYYGIGAAAAVRISNAMGQRDYRAARGNAYAAFQIVMMLAVVVGAMVFVLRHNIGSLFTPNDDVVHLVSLTVWPFLVYQIGDGMQIVFGNSLRGLAHVRPLVIYAFLAFFVISLPLSYLFGVTLDLGLIGVWYSFPFGLTTSGLLYFLAFRRQLDRLTRSGSERLGEVRKK